MNYRFHKEPPAALRSAAQELDAEGALAKGMAEKSREFIAQGGEGECDQGDDEQRPHPQFMSSANVWC